MARPRFYRDPIHNQIRYDTVDLGAPLPGDPGGRFAWVMQRLIDATSFQRLRQIRQNGLAYLAFQGAEHSRFCHSMGAAHLAGTMYDCVVRNMGEQPEPERRLATCVAALLHDLGHGPFSHTLEDILSESGRPFHHEEMTVRFLLEDSQVNRILREVDPRFPALVASFIEKRSGEEHWTDKLVSSQLDADRLDYILRDAASAGLPKEPFDLSRLLDMLCHLDGKRIAVDRRALADVEAYLLALDKMYRIVYFHHTVRAADFILASTLRRARWLADERGDERIFPTGVCRQPHPLKTLLETGIECPLDQYARLAEFHVWSLIEDWRHHDDTILADLASRLLVRRLFKSLRLGPLKYGDIQRLREKVEAATLEAFEFVDPETVSHYVTVDEPTRTSYKVYDWRGDDPDESIWIVRDRGDPVSIAEYPESRIVAGLKGSKSYPRLIFPKEVAASLEGLDAEVIVGL